MKTKTVPVVSIILAVLFSGVLHLHSEIFSVTNANTSGDGSLLKAIADANGNPGKDKIVFNISGNPPFIIMPTNNLPDLLQPVEIDATTQPGFSNYPVVVLDGSLAGTNANGITLSGGNSLLKGFAINNFKQNGLFINGGSSNIIQGNFIGTDITGRNSASNWESGILIYNSSYNLIGGTNSYQMNLISGSNMYGIYIYSSNSINNTVIGNLIGVDITGTNQLGNSQHGIVIISCSSNTIGGSTVDKRNIISGNRGTGILIADTGTKFNKVIGNFIGMDFTGTLIVSNELDGVYIYHCTDNQIGGVNQGEENLISGNGQNGITINNLSGGRNIIIGNLIGTDKSGSYSRGNSGNGIGILGTSNIIGGANLPANLISGNYLNGIYISTNSTGNIVQGNIIGLDLSATRSVSNKVSGILIDNSPSNIIGGNISNEGNIISGHRRGNGIFIRGQGSSNNIVQGNKIGIDISGLKSVPNGSGIGISNSPMNIIGGTPLLNGNTLSGNIYNGIYIQGEYAYRNSVYGNFIGMDSSGITAVPNNSDGVYITGAPSNIIGAIDLGNVISGNNYTAITIDGSLSKGNNIQGNIIGMRYDCSATIGNKIHGIEIANNAGNTLIGGINRGEGNIITGVRDEGYDGIRIRDGCVNNRIQGNAIFDNAGLGIDLSIDGVSTNDTGDADSGANNLQNFPVLTSATGNFKITILGNLNSLPSRQYTIDFYFNPSKDQSNYGEGRYWLGSTNIITDVSGNATFQISFTNPIKLSGYVSATATDTNGNTSEFGQDIVLTSNILVDTDNDGLPDEYELAFGFNPNKADDSKMDSDNDGKSNYNEYLDGTNPTDNSDKFELKIIGYNDSSLSIQFKAINGVKYTISHANRIHGTWINYLTNIVGFNRTLTFSLPSEKPNIFYKIKSEY